MKTPGLFKSFLITHFYCSSLRNIHPVTEKKKKEIPGGIHLQVCIGQAHTSLSEWLFWFSRDQAALPTIETQLACSCRGNTYHKAAVHFNQGSQSILQTLIASYGQDEALHPLYWWVSQGTRNLNNFCSVTMSQWRGCEQSVGVLTPVLLRHLPSTHQFYSLFLKTDFSDPDVFSCILYGKCYDCSCVALKFRESSVWKCLVYVLLNLEALHLILNLTFCYCPLWLFWATGLPPKIVPVVFITDVSPLCEWQKEFHFSAQQFTH